MVRRHYDSEKSCKNCQRRFKPRLDLTKNGKGIYCSVSCSNLARRVQLTISKKVIMQAKKKEGSIQKTAKALNVGWKPLYRRMQELGIKTSIRSRQPSTYESCYNSQRVRVSKHKVVAEKKYGRKVKKGEVVHHIDGNRQNNKPANLCILTRERHNNVHKQLEEIGMKLVKRGKVIFEEEIGYILLVKKGGDMDGG